MKALNHQQIKQQELQLLQTNGFSLGECSNSPNSNRILKELTNCLKITEIQRLKVSRVRNLGLSSNANLRSFCLALLTSIYSVHLKQDLLDIIKSFLYHPALDLSVIKHAPLSEISTKQMKKLVVQFFYSLVYSSYDDKIEGKLCKYPIIMDILVLFLRCILMQSKVKNAEDYLLKINSKDSFQALVEFFDLNCKVKNTMVLFFEDKLFLYQNQHGQSLIGNYSENQSQKYINNNEGTKLTLPQLSQQIDEDTENERSQRPSLTSHNRSLQLKGIVSESIVFEPQAPTPFFNFQHKSSSLFQSSHQNDKQTDKPQKMLAKSTKQANRLKAKDLSLCQSQKNSTFGSMKRTLLENQLKQSLQQKQVLAMDSPITLDSPHTLSLQGNIGKPRDQKLQKQIKTMKKSKSESSRPVSDPTVNNQQQSYANMKKKEKVYIGKPTKQGIKQCQCVLMKESSIKIHSNLYEINMRFVPSPNNSMRKTKTSLENLHDGNYYINSKGLNCQLYAPSPQITSMQHIRQKFLKQKAKDNLNASINSCYALPRIQKQSETQSKREPSPLSNVGERSFSPYGGTSSITSPKITFTYKNPLKYSIQIPKNKSKNKK